MTTLPGLPRVLLLALCVLLPMPAAGLLMAKPAIAADAISGVPETVDPGQQVTVAVDGTGGTLEIRGPDTGSGYDQVVGTHPLVGSAVTFAAPPAPGSYELRLLNPSGKVLARAELEVAAPAVILSIPDPLGAGYDARVLWRGPGAPGDTIQVYDPATGRVLSETPAAGARSAQNTAMLRMPDARGDFLIRYWYGAAGVPLRSIAVTVGDGRGWLRVPIEVVAGKQFQVSWHGPAQPGMEYRIVDPGSDMVVASAPVEPDADGARAVSFRAPKTPGKYRVQLVNTPTGFVIADLPLDVDPR
ncbi:MAG TPA: hypothetical protein VLA52_03945 [Thermohalobaculum sp.]|nr:hypothetical protein [Thermohalobaculum sp.]